MDLNLAIWRKRRNLCWGVIRINFWDVCFGCISWHPAGFGGARANGFGFGFGLPTAGLGSFSLFLWGLVLVLVLGSGLVISHCVMISRCSLLGGLRRRTFGYSCSRGYQFIEIPF